MNRAPIHALRDAADGERPASRHLMDAMAETRGRLGVRIHLPRLGLLRIPAFHLPPGLLSILGFGFLCAAVFVLAGTGFGFLAVGVSLLFVDWMRDHTSGGEDE